MRTETTKWLYPLREILHSERRSAKLPLEIVRKLVDVPASRHVALNSKFGAHLCLRTTRHNVGIRPAGKVGLLHVLHLAKQLLGAFRMPHEAAVGLALHMHVVGFFPQLHQGLLQRINVLQWPLRSRRILIIKYDLNILSVPIQRLSNAKQPSQALNVRLLRLLHNKTTRLVDLVENQTDCSEEGGTGPNGRHPVRPFTFTHAGRPVVNAKEAELRIVTTNCHSSTLDCTANHIRLTRASARRDNEGAMHSKRGPGGRRSHTSSAALLFSCANADKRGRHSDDAANNHLTVNPMGPMWCLCRLVTPNGGRALEQCTGSNSTFKLAGLEWFGAAGIELISPYIKIARRRIDAEAPPSQEVA